MLVISASLTSRIISLGYGRHVHTIDPSVLTLIGLLGYLSGVPVVLAIVWSKTSFAITLVRLVQGRLKAFIWFIIITMNLFMIISIINIWISCSPVEKLYNPTVPGRCWPINVIVDYAIFSGCKFSLPTHGHPKGGISGWTANMTVLVIEVYFAAMYFILALLPWKLIMKLNMRKVEKVGVALAMSMGILWVLLHASVSANAMSNGGVCRLTIMLVSAGAAAIVKVIQFRSMSGGDFTCKADPRMPAHSHILITTLANSATTDDGCSLVIWSFAEAAVTMVAASVPVLRVLIRDATSSMSSKYETRQHGSMVPSRGGGGPGAFSSVAATRSKRATWQRAEESSQCNILNNEVMPMDSFSASTFSVKQ